jgi:hypothetical protein
MIMPAPRRHLRLIPSPAHPDAGRQSFPVRFTAASDRLAWLRQPANAFGWIGDGAVRFVPEGVLVLGRRLTFWGRRGSPRLIRPDEIRDVYREGNTVQINLRDGSRRRPFLRFWTEDVADAAELVARLPTTRTIELATLLRAPQTAGEALRPSIWFLALAAVALVVLAGLKALQSPRLEAPVPAPAATPLPHLAAPAATDELQQTVDAASAVEVLQSRADLERFGPRFDALTQQFAMAFNALTVGTLSQGEFADGLDKWLLPQWAALAVQLPQAPAATLRGRADSELGGVIASWQRALRLYADGLRARNSSAVNAAFDAMREAEGHEGRARQLLWRLESRQEASARAANR